MFWERFVNLCAENNTTPNAVAKIIGVSSATVTYWKQGAQPRAVVLKKLADHFNVPASYFSEQDPSEPKDELTEYLEELKSRPEMKMLFSVAKGATKEDIEKAVAIIEALRKTGNG